jgi:hypothetical protein
MGLYHELRPRGVGSSVKSPVQSTFTSNFKILISACDKMEYLLPFLATRCLLDSGTIKARYLHRAFCTYLSEHGQEPIDRATFLEWMHLRAPEFIYSMARRTFGGLALIPVVSPNKRPSPEPSISPRKRCKNQLISSSDPFSETTVLTVDPLMFIDRTNMPMVADTLTKEAYQAYRQWNLAESERLQRLRLDSNVPPASLALAPPAHMTTDVTEASDTSPPRDLVGLAEIQASLESMQQLLARELESIQYRYERTQPILRPIRIGSSRQRVRSPTQTRSRINPTASVDIFNPPESQDDLPRSMAQPEVMIHSDEETPLLPRVNIVHPAEPVETPMWTPEMLGTPDTSGTTGPTGSSN